MFLSQTRQRQTLANSFKLKFHISGIGINGILWYCSSFLCRLHCAHEWNASGLCRQQREQGSLCGSLWCRRRLILLVRLIPHEERLGRNSGFQHPRTQQTGLPWSLAKWLTCQWRELESQAGGTVHLAWHSIHWLMIDLSWYGSHNNSPRWETGYLGSSYAFWPLHKPCVNSGVQTWKICREWALQNYGGIKRPIIHVHFNLLQFLNPIEFGLWRFYSLEFKILWFWL